VIEIKDLADRRVSDYTHVGEPDWLRERGLFVAEGRLVVRRLFETSITVHSVLVTGAALAALPDSLDPERCPIYACDQDTMNRLAGFNFHRGCLAIAERPPAIDPQERFADARCLIALEGVGNPDNVGGLFRVAAAFGVGGVLLDRTTGDPLYRKAIRTSMGSTFRLPFARIDPWLATIGNLSDRDADLVALTPDPAAATLADFTRNRGADRPLILMLGAEGPGLSPDARAAATANVRIPIRTDVDSLNVVVAAGIALSVLSDPTGQ
jgi:tRNA G18 (ribose-2'-O)-methylase SpoU